MRWRLRLVVPLLALAFATAGCAYFNTFYAAKKNFENAELQRSQQYEDREARANAGQAALYDQAIQGASKVVVEYPRSKWVDDALLLIGRSLLAKGEYRGAQEKFDELNTNFPTSDLRDQATYWSAVAADRDHRSVDALTLYDSLLATYPKFKQRDDARLRRASVHLTMRQPALALDDLRDLATRKGQIGYDAGLKLAEALFTQRDYAGARAGFTRVAEQAPTEQLRLEARLRAGDSDEAAGEYAHAAESYLKLLRDSRTDDGKARARLRYGSALALSGDVDRGLAELANVVTDYPRTPYAAEALFRTGYLHEVVRDDFEAAGKAYDRVAEQSPGSPFVPQARDRRENLSRLAESLAALKDTSAAGRAAELILRQAEYYLFQVGKPERALEEYTKLERDCPQNRLAPRAGFARGWVLARRLGRPDEAKVAFQSVIRKYPDTDESKAAARLLAFPTDSTFANDRLAGTALQFPLVPGNPGYVPPPPVPTSRSNRASGVSTRPMATAPAASSAGDSLAFRNANAAATAHTDSLRARADSIRAAQRGAPGDTSKPKLKLEK